MESTRRHIHRFKGAYFVMLRYVAYNMLLFANDWLVLYKQLWLDHQLTSWHYTELAVKLAINALVAIGAVTNDSWAKAKDSNGTTQ